MGGRGEKERADHVTHTAAYPKLPCFFFFLLFPPFFNAGGLAEGSRSLCLRPPIALLASGFRKQDARIAAEDFFSSLLMIPSNLKKAGAGKKRKKKKAGSADVVFGSDLPEGPPSYSFAAYQTALL